MIFQTNLPAWSLVKQPHPTYPSASAALTVKYDSVYGRHVVANRDIEVGEVLFNEEPIVHYLNNADEDVVNTPACHHCLMYIRSGLVPCPTCSSASFCRWFVYIFTVWKFQHFPDFAWNQSRHPRRSEDAILYNFGDSEFWFFGPFQPFQSAKDHRNKISEPVDALKWQFWKLQIY